MEKTMALQKLKAQGYTAIEENGIVMVNYTGEEDPFEEVKTFLRGIGYADSFGTKRRKNTGNPVLENINTVEMETAGI